MDNKENNSQPKEMRIELSEQVAAGHDCNLSVISHGPGEFYLDFINMAPNMPQPRVQSRIIMTPENVKNLFYALGENIKRYESIFGEIRRTVPVSHPGNPGETPNPFYNGGKLN